LVEALKCFAHDIFESVQMSVEKQNVDGDFVRLDKKAFMTCRSESIDYAVLEKHQNVVMVPFQGVWSDVGSWGALAELSAPDQNGNCIIGQGRVYEADSTYIHAEHRPVVALGTKELFIVDTSDAVLVANKSYAEKVKDVVASLEQEGLQQAFEHRHVTRPWGEYDCIDEGHRFKVKRIKVKAGSSLSLQLHHHRAEHWVVVKGTARVTCGNKTFLLSENESTYIPIGMEHRLENPGAIVLEMIEVQSGSYLGEDDIRRLDDDYGRSSG